MTYMGGTRNIPSPMASPNCKITDKLMLEVDEIKDEVNQFISPRASKLMSEMLVTDSNLESQFKLKQSTDDLALK